MSNLPPGWTSAKLNEVADLLDFEREPVNASEREGRVAGKRREDLFAYYGATGQVGFIDGYRSDGERVLLGEDGAPFLEPTKSKAYLASGRFWVNNHAHVLRGAADLIDNRFLCHQLNVVDYHPHVTGSTRLKLTSGAMQQIALSVAPQAEQSRIVAKLEELLSGLDAGVAELKAAQKKLTQYRQSLLKAAVEGALTADWRAARRASEAPSLDPVGIREASPRYTARADSPAIETETGAQLLDRILSERRARWEAKQLAKFKEQGKTPPKNWQSKYPEPVAPGTRNLPTLPDGWVWASLDQLSSMVRNGLSQKPSTEPAGFRILRINAVRPMLVNLEEVRYLKISKEEAQDYLLEEGDLLATRYNGSVDLLGVVGVVRGLKKPTLHPDKLIRIRPVLDNALAEWIEICAATGSSRLHVASRVKTTAGQTGISGDDIKKMPVPLAPLSEQMMMIEQIQAALRNVQAQSVAIETSLKQSAAQRQNVLRAAFAGQLVPQDPNDEPASKLLERIRAERARVSIAGKPKRTRRTASAAA